MDRRERVERHLQLLRELLDETPPGDEQRQYKLELLGLYRELATLDAAPDAARGAAATAPPGPAPRPAEAPDAAHGFGALPAAPLAGGAPTAVLTREVALIDERRQGGPSEPQGPPATGAMPPPPDLTVTPRPRPPLPKRRGEYWSVLLVAVVAAGLAWTVDTRTLLATVGVAVPIVLWFGVGRLRDAGYSAWWILLVCFPPALLVLQARRSRT
jgi:hypothetical protein